MAQHLLICSGGGHLKELQSMATRMEIPRSDQTWVTFDTGLSRSLLADRETIFAPYAAPRDVFNVLRNTVRASKLLRHRRFAAAYSTGANLAVSYLHLAAHRGLECHFIESAARATGPSMTGSIVARDHRIHTYTQYRSWASARWLYSGSIFDEFEPGPPVESPAVRTAVVTVGTTESYSFRRLFDAVAPLLAGCEVLWQTGTTDISDLGLTGRSSVPYDELRQAMSEADVVVTHSGTGNALTALEVGKLPILIPRSARFYEHVDDHQVQIATELHDRGIGISCRPEDLSAETLQRAAAGSVVRRADLPKFELTSHARTSRR